MARHSKLMFVWMSFEYLKIIQGKYISYLREREKEKRRMLYVCKPRSCHFPLVCACMRVCVYSTPDAHFSGRQDRPLSLAQRYALWHIWHNRLMAPKGNWLRSAAISCPSSMLSTRFYWYCSVRPDVTTTWHKLIWQLSRLPLLLLTHSRTCRHTHSCLPHTHPGPQFLIQPYPICP